METPAPLFSVIVPVYNRAHILGRALKSVLDQQCQDFEIIVVDDGSTDSPELVVAGFLDPRVKFITQTNRGGSAARNAGIRAASGRFVAFLDSDDWFLPHHLAVMRVHLLSAEDERLVCYTPMIVNRGNGVSYSKPSRPLAEGEHMATYLMSDRGFVPTSTLVLTKVCASKVLYDERLPFGQDTDFALRLFLAGCRFEMIKAPGAVLEDAPDPTRVSRGRRAAQVTNWLEELRGSIPPAAYHGYRGWHIAKSVAQEKPVLALALFARAAFRRSYRLKIAIVVLSQIIVPPSIYRNLADKIIASRRLNVNRSGKK